MIFLRADWLYLEQEISTKTRFKHANTSVDYWSVAWLHHNGFCPEKQIIHVLSKDTEANTDDWTDIMAAATEILLHLIVYIMMRENSNSHKYMAISISYYRHQKSDKALCIHTGSIYPTQIPTQYIQQTSRYKHLRKFSRQTSDNLEIEADDDKWRQSYSSSWELRCAPQ